MSGQFGPGIPDLGTGPTDHEDPQEIEEQDDGAEIVTTRANRRGSVSVTSTDAGLPVAVSIDPAELRAGGVALSAVILELCGAARDAGRSRRRAQLADAGVGDDMLERLGYPRTDRDTGVEADPPTSWMRPV